MAKFKHALTKEGAILAITRNQVAVIRRRSAKNFVRKSFLDLYADAPDEQIKQAYLNEFGIELEIVKQRNNGKG